MGGGGERGLRRRARGWDFVLILELRDGKVFKETCYYAEPFEASEERSSGSSGWSARHPTPANFSELRTREVRRINPTASFSSDLLVCLASLGASHRFWSAILTLSALDRRSNTVFGRPIRVSDAVGINQPVEKLPLYPLRPQIELQTHRIWALVRASGARFVVTFGSR